VKEETPEATGEGVVEVFHCLFDGSRRCPGGSMAQHFRKVRVEEIESFGVLKKEKRDKAE